MLVIWNERASPLRERAGAVRAVMSSPAKRMRPASGRRLPASWLISVVFPAPFGPMTACVSPSRTSRSTPSVARSAPNAFDKPRISSSASVIVPGSGQQPGEAAPEKQHRGEEEQPEEELPVLGPAREQVLEDEQRGNDDF